MVSGQFRCVGENHKRAIVTTLALLDEMLCGFEQIARGHECHAVMYSERNTLSEDQRRTVRAEIAQMRKIIRQIKESLGLEEQTEDLGAKIWASSSAFWEVLVEMKSRYLKRYGDPPRGLAEYLDPLVDNLIAHMAVISEASRPASGGDRRHRAERSQDPGIGRP